MYVSVTGSRYCFIQPDPIKYRILLKIHKNEGKYSPNEVSDDEELDDTVDDADGPALHYHRLGGFIGEEVCYTRPHPSNMCVTKKLLCLCMFCM